MALKSLTVAALTVLLHTTPVTTPSTNEDLATQGGPGINCVTCWPIEGS